MRILLRAALAAAFLFCGLGMVQAATIVCAPYKTITNRLTTKYGEVRVWMGAAKKVNRVEIWAKRYGLRHKRTWTALTVSSNGRACIVQAGWGSNEDPVPGEGSL